MDKIEQHLTEIGLTPSEAAVYTAGLQHGPLGVHEFGRITTIKRPTIYHALHLLEEKGLAAKKGTGRRLVFTMQPAERLRSLLQDQAKQIEKKQDALETLLPLFITKTAGASIETNVEHVEGIAGMKTLVEEALYCKSRRWDILAPKNNFFSQMDPVYAKQFLRTRSSREIVARSLWERPDTSGAKETRRLTPQELKERHPRYLPDVFKGRFASTLILFDQKVVILSSHDQAEGILIQSSETHQLLSMMFDGLWLVSEPYEKVMK
ncbi:hypothetical protein KBA73_03025 [Patescibacteria group bacterium]|nr:hypothetical protein [Patescibacteria group bacterium]